MDFLIETNENILRNVHHSDKFVADSFEEVFMGVGLSFIVGKPIDTVLIQQLINPEKVMVQAVKFMKPEWTLESALDWLRENQKDFTHYQSTKKMFKSDLKEIKGVEIFSAGTWNGDTFTTKDLDNMVQAFKDTAKTVRPFLKLGHSDEQKLLEAEGLPAAGWIGNIYRKGEKLIADFIDIPTKIFELIENKSYRNVSSEIYFDISIKDQKYSRLLSAVALLGAETPAVMNLSDILDRFGLKDYASLKTFAEKQKDVTIKTYSIENKVKNKQGEPIMSKTEQEIALELKLEALQTQLDETTVNSEQFKTDLEAKTTELEKSNTDKDAALKQVFETEKAKKEIELEKQVDTLVNEKLISKSMKPYALALLKNEVDEKTKKYSFKKADKDEKPVELDRFELIKEFTTLAKTISDVNFDESSDEGEKVISNEDAVEKYSIDNKVSYSEAYRMVNEGKLKMAKPNVTEI